MMWQDQWNSWGWAAWCLMFTGLLVITGLAIWMLTSFGRNDNRRPSPERVLADRFARGEITEDVYTRQRSLIRDKQ